MVKMSTELREIATRFQEADAEQVNLAGGFGAAGAIVATMGKGDSSLEDKGYRMAYNSALHAWLPVNDKGVTDQAALQAYQRDKGNLDVQGMQSAGNTVTPEEDIYAMQIKAYESGIHPFSGEPVSDSLAQYMVVSLKLGQVFMAVQGIRSGMSGSKGPYRLPANHPVTAKIQKNIDAAKAKGANAGGNVKEGTGDSAQIPRTGAEWNDYYKSKHGDGNTTWVTELKSYDDILSNPKALWGKSADEVGRTLGDGWTIGTYGSAGTGWKYTNGDKSVFYHPGGGVHEGSYIGFSSGQTGKVKVVGPDYKPLPGDKATVIQK